MQEQIAQEEERRADDPGEGVVPDHGARPGAGALGPGRALVTHPAAEADVLAGPRFDPGTGESVPLTPVRPRRALLRVPLMTPDGGVR